MGRAAGQSVFARQATQVSDAVSQTAPIGLPLQSVLVAHWAHCWVVGSQTGALIGQSVAVTQPTHAPVAWSQMGVRPPAAHSPASATHDAWHVWLLGKQTSPAAQSALVPHASQLPRTQTLAPAAAAPGGGQFALVSHCTQPSAGSQS